MQGRRIDTRAVLFTIALATVFWHLTFSVKLLNFWLSMSIAAVTLALLAFWFGGMPFKREELTLRAFAIGVASAVVLYGIFWMGHLISGLLFDFARPQVSSIYDIRSQGQGLVIALVLVFVTSPGEELFWRNFLQKWAMQRLGPARGWVLGSVIYGAVHISSGNFMLTMAALIAGLFWGYIYWREKSVVPGIISHAVWTVAIFVLFPMM